MHPNQTVALEIEVLSNFLQLDQIYHYLNLGTLKKPNQKTLKLIQFRKIYWGTSQSLLYTESKYFPQIPDNQKICSKMATWCKPVLPWELQFLPTIASWVFETNFKISCMKLTWKSHMGCGCGVHCDPILMLKPKLCPLSLAFIINWRLVSSQKIVVSRIWTPWEK